VVKKIRGITGEKKVGHGGTLDPFAEGVLIIGTGADTKKLTGISGHVKSYRAVLKLGIETDTLDLEGNAIKSAHVPNLDEADVQQTLISFLGDYEQTPPMYSAKKINGVRLYKLARQNKTVEREPSVVQIHQIVLNGIFEDKIDFFVTCSKGTYIRALGMDIAKKLGTVGHLVELQRIAVGDRKIQDSIKIEEFEAEWISTVH